jgi:glutamate decarboxylase
LVRCHIRNSGSKKMKASGKSIDKPNIVFGHNAQVVLKKFALYFDVEYRTVPVTPESHYVMDPKEAIKLVDENTICVVAILGSTYTGQFENVKELNDLLEQLHAEKGIDVHIHVDAASGGFVAPFAFPDLVWDFRLPRVRSINASGHKYGLVYPGIGWVIWRDSSALPKDLVLHLDYLGGDLATYSLNFSRSSVHVIGQYYNLLRLGREGYTQIISSCLAGARFLSEELLKSGYFELKSDIHNEGVCALPVVTFSLKDEVKRPRKAETGEEKGKKKEKEEEEPELFDEYAVMRMLQRFGWIVPAYKLPPACDKMKILRVVVREIHSRDILHGLVKDILLAVDLFRDSTQLPLTGAHPNEKKVPPVEGQKTRTYSSVC